MARSLREDAHDRFSLVSGGFMALDIVLGQVSRVAAGGTAANVAAAVVAMGWQSSVVGTVGDDAAGRYLRKDLESAGVDTTRLQLNASWTTPVVLQEMVAESHVWRFVCPECGSRFARHRPSPPSEARELARNVAAPNVFFFDRPSLFTLELASEWRANGSMIVFEPASLGRPVLFDRAVGLAHLVKYSSQRGSGFEDRLTEVAAAVVRTEGADGSIFRAAFRSRFRRVEAVELPTVVDTAGAGDWTTAGFLADLFAHSASPIISLSRTNDVLRALRAGQSWGARACGWEGARPAHSSRRRASARGAGTSVPALYCPTG